MRGDDMEILKVYIFTQILFHLTFLFVVLVGMIIERG